MFLCRFGGGSELMREGDKDGIWTILEQGTRCVAKLGTRSLADAVACTRAATFFANIPWLGIYVGTIPALVRPIQTFVTHGQRSVERRMARGSTMRDLFHYLVSGLSAYLRHAFESSCFIYRTTRIFQIKRRRP